ncbi:hypothetical protein GLOTRDRAFT_109396 [Gloeophyllum trabeum ATCC 11539]|uniref:Uncharacterized protein n=1 Tax=Gloeophyllum trabeum (strain ATCC 11539 / FP-39264 / Madison 617) TaxID=670483 RepID=S7S5P5_GLOTA|nr:uncharacterized protein GLOTRDRAFT_109396 [Gloeophyllum trabeum ATCC 11539]EPQ61329.1 hypothetical protein GLOTRDRAFT_109396 [Gloeophyllum trabeum ATCC 11539]
MTREVSVNGRQRGQQAPYAQAASTGSAHEVEVKEDGALSEPQTGIVSEVSRAVLE